MAAPRALLAYAVTQSMLLPSFSLDLSSKTETWLMPTSVDILELGICYFTFPKVHWSFKILSLLMLFLLHRIVFLIVHTLSPRGFNMVLIAVWFLDVE